VNQTDPETGRDAGQQPDGKKKKEKDPVNEEGEGRETQKENGKEEEEEEGNGEKGHALSHGLLSLQTPTERECKRKGKNKRRRAVKTFKTFSKMKGRVFKKKGHGRKKKRLREKPLRNPSEICCHSSTWLRAGYVDVPGKLLPCVCSFVSCLCERYRERS
jgi:hypothetical protein